VATTEPQLPAEPATSAGPEPAAVPEPEPAAEPVAGPPAGGTTNGSDDLEAARLVALNMALDGTPREETERYLADHFGLSDRRSLLDEVYSSVEG
jgi:hypothetical protein